MDLSYLISKIGKPVIFRGSRIYNRSGIISIIFKMGLLACLLILVLVFGTDVFASSDDAVQGTHYIISGQLLDKLAQPVEGADIIALEAGDENPLAETESRSDGTWSLQLDTVPPGNLEIHVDRSHYVAQSETLDQTDLKTLTTSGLYYVREIELERKIDISFWIATFVFLAVLLLIAFEFLHSATAALAGISVLLLTSYVGGAYHPSLKIYTFEQALGYIDWEVIFLLIGMMIIIAIIEGTGIFQWMAFQAYRLSRGRSWLLVLILMGITVIASALLDNFTTMLLMVPISLQIGMALGINPLALIIPEVLASNVGGITTLVGTPTNILIGAYAGIGFNDFLANQTVGVLIALIVMGAYVLFHYRKEWAKQSGGISEMLYAKLEENERGRRPPSQ